MKIVYTFFIKLPLIALVAHVSRLRSLAAPARARAPGSGCVSQSRPGVREMEETRVLRRRTCKDEKAREIPQAPRPRGIEGPQAAGDGHQGAAGARESAGDNETGVGPRQKPTPR